MSNRAVGKFEVKISPLELNFKEGVQALGRMSLEKQFNGDLVATSKGEMLTAGNPSSGSAGYVAVEQVIGELHGRSGTFLLQHHATMQRGTSELSIIVVPDSGTGQLQGLAGQLEILNNNGDHSYVFNYTLPETNS